MAGTVRRCCRGSSTGSRASERKRTLLQVGRPFLFAVGGAVLSVSNVFEIGQDKAKSLLGIGNQAEPQVDTNRAPSPVIGSQKEPGWPAWSGKTTSPAWEREKDRKTAGAMEKGGEKAQIREEASTRHR